MNKTNRVMKNELIIRAEAVKEKMYETEYWSSMYNSNSILPAINLGKLTAYIMSFDGSDWMIVAIKTYMLYLEGYISLIDDANDMHKKVEAERSLESKVRA